MSEEAQQAELAAEQAKPPLPRRRPRVAVTAEPAPAGPDAPPALPVVTLGNLLDCDPAAEATVWAALDKFGFRQDGDTFRDSLAGLQRYLGNRPDGRPDRHSLVWLSLRSQMFTVH